MLISLDSTRATGVAGTTSCWWITLVVQLAPRCKNICQPWLKHASYSSFHRSWMITGISFSECEYCCTMFDWCYFVSHLWLLMKTRNGNPKTSNQYLFYVHFTLYYFQLIHTLQWDIIHILWNQQLAHANTYTWYQSTPTCFSIWPPL